MKNRVLVVEDHHLLRQGLCSLVGALSDFTVVGEASDGKEALRQALALKPDLTLMDLSLPRVSGIEATKRIKARLPRARILALTAYKSDEYVNEALRAGVDGYVMKDVAYDELVGAMRSVMAGKKYLSPDISGQLVHSLLHGGEQPRPRSAWERLTPRERGILKLIAEGRTNRSAAEFLSVSPKTVEKHRGNLMRKLGIGNLCELTLVALDIGLIERPLPVSRLFGNGDDPRTQQAGCAQAV